MRRGLIGLALLALAAGALAMTRDAGDEPPAPHSAKYAIDADGVCRRD